MFKFRDIESHETSRGRNELSQSSIERQADNRCISIWSSTEATKTRSLFITLNWIIFVQ